MGEFNDKNLFLTFLILIMCIGIFYLALITHRTFKNQENDMNRFYMMNKNVYPGYIIGMTGIVFSIYQLFKWLFEYVK